MFKFWKFWEKKESKPLPVRRKWVVFGEKARRIRELYDLAQTLGPDGNHAARFDLWTYVNDVLAPHTEDECRLELVLDGERCCDARCAVILESPDDEPCAYRIIVVE